MPYHIFFNNTIIVQVRYIIIETKEFARIGYNGFLFPHSYSGDFTRVFMRKKKPAPRPSPESHAEKETRYIQYGPLLLFQQYCILYLYNNTPSKAIVNAASNITYRIIETRKFAGFLFPHSYSGDGLGATHLGLHLSIHVEKETRYIQNGPLLLFLIHVV